MNGRCPAGARHGRLLLTCVLAWACPRATLSAAPVRLHISAPERGTGDGTAQALLRVTTKPTVAFKRLRGIHIEVTAGRLGGRKVSDTSLTIPWMLPCVAVATRVTVSVAARLGQRRLVAKESIRVVPGRRTTSALVSSGPLDLRVEPGQLVLGRDASASVSIVATRNKGSLARILASVGRVSALEQGKDGRLRATYFAPPSSHPQVAIIVALAGEGESVHDWVALPLYGSGTVRLRPGDAQDVAIAVGDVRFGPFRASVSGSMDVPIIAPPGVTVGTMVVDGGPGEEIDLGVPPFKRLMVACARNGDRALTFCVDPRGRPDPAAGIAVSVSAGAVSATQKLAPGVYESIYMPADGARVGRVAKLVARLIDTQGSVARCWMPVRAGPPVKASLHLDRPFYVAGSGTPVVVEIDARDLGGRSARHVPTVLTPDMGQVSAPKVSAKGLYAATWMLPNHFDGRQRAHLTAQLDTQGQTVRTEVSIELQPGRVASLSVDATTQQLRANGVSSTEVTVAPLDAFGNPIRKANLKIHAMGSFSELQFDESARLFRTTYTAPRHYSNTVDAVTIREEQSDAEGRVEIFLKAGREPLLLGVRAGYGTNFAKVSGWTVAGDVGARVALLSEALVVGLEAGTSYDTHRTHTAGGAAVATDLWVTPLLARLTYELDTVAGLLYAGVVAGASLVGTETRSEMAGRQRATEVCFAWGAVGGAGFRLGPGAIVLETAYRRAQSVDVQTQGNVAGLAVTSGYRVHFGE